MIFGTVICLFAKRWPKFWTFALCAAIPLAAGGLSALLTRGSMDDFAALNQPPLAPPGWLFPIVWTILFILMGTASYLVVTAPTSPQADVGHSLWLYGMQLGVNFFWSIFFFCNLFNNLKISTIVEVHIICITNICNINNWLK